MSINVFTLTLFNIKKYFSDKLSLTLFDILHLVKC